MRGFAICGFAVIAVIAAAGGEARAEAPKRDCSKPALRKARGEADKAVRAKDHARAAGVLEPVLRECSAGKELVERAWLASDLAAAYEKQGLYVECMRLMGPLSHPRSGLQEAGSDKLVKAIDHNLARCSKGLDAKYAAIKPGGCAVTVPQAIATAAAPAALVPKGVTAACVALVRGKPAPKDPDDDPEVADVACPALALVWKGAKGLERRELATGDTGALADDSVCCNLSSLAAGTVDGKTLVRVRGEGRDCSGGTADSASDVFYEWTAGALRVALDASVAYH